MPGKLAIKLTIQGALIYGMMAAYLSAFVMLLVGEWRSRSAKGRGEACRKVGLGLFFLGFVIGVAAFAYRWVHVGHVPMQNLFEVFLSLGMLVFLISIFCRRFLGVGGEAADSLLGFIVLFPAGFIFSAEPQTLPPALQSWLFAPHVAAYMLAYVVLAKAGIQAVKELLKLGPAGEGLVTCEQATYRMVRLGFPLLTLGLILGCFWGKIAWGDYWNWDPKELWSLVSWLVYVLYLHFRYMYGVRFKTVNSMLAVAGLAAIIITLLWVNLARIFGGLHSYA